MSVLPTKDGKKYLLWNHSRSGHIQQSTSIDGGLTWKKQVRPLDQTDFPNVRLTEPAVIRSPDGKQLLMLIRENNRRYNSLYATSDDEGQTWSKPRELPLALSGDRHSPTYAPDGRLVITMRERRPAREGVYTEDWVGYAGPTGTRPDIGIEKWYAGHVYAWVGRYEGILEGREGEYRVELFHQH